VTFDPITLQGGYMTAAQYKTEVARSIGISHKAEPDIVRENAFAQILPPRS